MKNKIPDFQQVELCPVAKWGVLSVLYFIVRSLYLTKAKKHSSPRAALPISVSVCNMFVCPNNDMAASVWGF